MLQRLVDRLRGHGLLHLLRSMPTNPAVNPALSSPELVPRYGSTGRHDERIRCRGSPYLHPRTLPSRKGLSLPFFSTAVPPASSFRPRDQWRDDLPSGAETTEAFGDVHMPAFSFLGGMP